MSDGKFLETAAQFDMFREGDDVVVGLSGGADSVCLISLLLKHRQTLGVNLRAAHVNHGIRGASADADEAFVRQFCRERDIPLSVLRADVPALARQSGESTELCARRIRYEFFDSLSADKIATAHTLSDAQETFFMNLSRGASLHGLTSIPPVRGKIVRPLIRFTGKETQQYCKDNALPFVTDETNGSNDYTRNRYRHSVIPQLQALNPAFDASFQRCLENLRAEDDFISRETDKAFALLMIGGGLDIDGYLLLHPALRYRVLARFLARIPDADYETKHIKLIDGNIRTPGFALMLPGGGTVTVERNLLKVKEPRQAVLSQSEITVPADTSAQVVYNGYRISFIRPTPADIPLYSPDERIDPGKLGPVLTVRGKLPGDRITLAKRKCTKSLKKLYGEMKYSEPQRRLLPVIADERGVIWAYGAGAEASRLADKKTQTILIIHSESDKNDK